MKTKKPSSRNGSYKRLFECMKPYKAKLIIAIIVIFLSCIAYAAAPLLMGTATDSLAKLLSGGEMDGKFLKFLALMGGAYGLNAILSYIGTSLIVSVSESTIYELRKRVD